MAASRCELMLVGLLLRLVLLAAALVLAASDALWMNTLRVGFVSAARAGAKGPEGAGPSALPTPLASISLKGALSRSC